MREQLKKWLGCSSLEDEIREMARKRFAGGLDSNVLGVYVTDYSELEIVILDRDQYDRPVK